jgi:phage terminase large subunit-like protein
MTKKPNKLLLAAVEKLEKLRRQECFDPANADSKPTPAQQEVIDDITKHKIQIIRSGNQCLAKGTLVMTPAGPVAIENIKVGDIVYSEHGNPIKVLKTFDNGFRKVRHLVNYNKIWATATDDHVWLTHNYDKSGYDKGTLSQQPTASLGEFQKVARQFVVAPLGPVRESAAYALGALLGDGCSRQRGRQVWISSANCKIPNKVAELIGATHVKKNSDHNYNWSLGCDKDNWHSLYISWCAGRYAHEKTVDLDVIKTWDRQSAIEFVAGLFDTEGSLSGNEKARTINWNISMQAIPVIDALEYLLLALWQVPCTRAIDDRAKYKNGPVHQIKVTNPHDVVRIMTELQPHILSEQKHWKDIYNTYGKRSFTDRVTLRSTGGETVQTYDIHVDSPTNLYLLANGLVTHNSGKSQTCARILTWVLTDTHPKWNKPTAWGNEPLLALVCGRTGRQIEESLLPKIRSYLEPGTFKEIRIGNIIQRLELNNGNRIVFQSLENPNMARERIQSYVAHLVWLDELPPIVDILNELLIRIQARDGHFIASFTPLVRNVQVQKFVDGLTEPMAKTYRFRMLDNPLYKDPQRQAEILASLSHLPEHVRNSRLFGDWMSDDNAVFYFDYSTMVELPINYSPLWRHVESVDPAVKSALGYTLWAENPETGIWYCIKAEYIKGIYVPTELVQTVAKLSQNVNIVRRISDPHEAWYIHTAASMGISYTGVYRKNDRKAELIKNFQEELGKSLKISPTAELLIDEITSARWSDAREGKIASGSDYHLLDSSQYFQDVKPKREAAPQTSTNWQSWLYNENEKRKMNVEKAKMELHRKAVQRRGGNHARRFQ